MFYSDEGGADLADPVGQGLPKEQIVEQSPKEGGLEQCLQGSGDSQ